jgi:hypothetical protein
MAIYSAQVTRPGRSSRGVAALFARDPYAAVLRVLGETGAALTAAEIKQAIGAPGLDTRDWDRLQKRLRVDDHVAVEPGHRYRWVDDPVVPPAAQAFEQIVRAAGGRVKHGYADVVRQALTDAADPRETEARQRQAVTDGIRALAELASEVEELAVNQPSARALVHRVRGRVKLAGLEPIERAGETATFDRRRHESIGSPIRDGAPVIVIRPGYTWTTAQGESLVARAVVQE